MQAFAEVFGEMDGFGVAEILGGLARSVGDQLKVFS
jgi:hypothetical protein